MSLSITEIARLHKDTILKQINAFETKLLPSSEADQELVRRAVFSVRNKSVIFDRYIPFSTNLYINVQDVREAKVVIEFSKETISCSCPATSICRHQLAALLSLYQFLGSVQDWTSAWRAKKNIQLESLVKQRSPENWHSLIDEVLKPQLMNKKVEGYAIMSVVDMVRARLSSYTPYEREWVTLYKLFCEVGIFTALLKNIEKIPFPDSNLLYYTQFYTDRALEKMQTLIDDLSNQSRLFEFDAYIDTLQQMAFDLLTIKSQVQSQQMHLYMQLWEKLFTEESRAIKEIAQIEQADAANTLKVAKKPLMLIFSTILKDEDKIDALLDGIDATEVEAYITASKFANSREQLHVAETILRNILPFIHTHLHDIVPVMQRQAQSQKIVQLYEGFTFTQNEKLQLYASLGKFGILPYSFHLIEMKQFENWSALHSLHSSSISYLETCGLKTVLAESPATLLPIYHSFAMEELKQKSRVNYKQAVRLWKSMRSAAKKSGKMSYFEEYMVNIRANYKRLRALQEELDKGNL